MNTGITQGQILHVFGWDRKFFASFREFIHKYFDDERQEFIVYGCEDDIDAIKSCDTDVFSDLIKSSFKISKKLSRADKIFFHGLFNNHLFYILALQPWLLKKCYWIIWGGDLYGYSDVEKDWRWWKDWLFRSFVIKRIGNLVTYTKGDYDLVKEMYGAKGKYVECLVYEGNTFQPLSEHKRKGDAISILIGNSATKSNNHIQILEMLRPYANQNISIYAPLSYGDSFYASKVMRQGKEIFGDKFVALTEFLPLDQYLEFLGDVDVAVFNHQRQQGMGVLITLLGMGKTVYLLGDTTLRKLFLEHGLILRTTLDKEIHLISDNEAESNIKKIRQYFSVNRLVAQWKIIFDSIPN